MNTSLAVNKKGLLNLYVHVLPRMTNTRPKYCHLDLYFGICDSIGHYIGTIFGEMYHLKVVLKGLIFGELISEFKFWRSLFFVMI